MKMQGPTGGAPQDYPEPVECGYVMLHPLGEPAPEGWKIVGALEGHHGHWSCLVEKIAASGTLDDDPPAPGGRDHVHALITTDGRLCVFGNGQSLAVKLDQRNLIRLAAEATGAALGKG